MFFTTEELKFMKTHAAPPASGAPFKGKVRGGIFVFGTGISQVILYHCCKANDFPVDGFIVSKTNGETEFCGLPVKNIRELVASSDILVLIAGGYAREMAELCQRYALPFVYCNQLSLKNLVGRGCQPFPADTILTNSHYDALYALLADEESRQVLKDILMFRVTLEPSLFQKYSPLKKYHYFSPSLVTKIDYRFFVDCGAYTGDTFAVWRDYMASQQPDSCCYYGIEGVQQNFVQLQETVAASRMPCELYCAVVSDTAGKRFIFDGATDPSSINFWESTSEDSVESTTLDSLLAGRKVTALKADIEGAELPMLEGARECIRQQHPALLISAYHYPDDLYQIPLKILEINPAYKIYLRQHLPHFTETVCYALLE